jgi:succinate dehydrogenase/fumarate reductase cytochrome b subunit
MAKRRPVFFNLLQIQLPLGALTSITHRITGVILALDLNDAYRLFRCRTIRLMMVGDSL